METEVQKYQSEKYNCRRFFILNAELNEEAKEQLQRYTVVIFFQFYKHILAISPEQFICETLVVRHKFKIADKYYDVVRELKSSDYPQPPKAPPQRRLHNSTFPKKKTGFGRGILSRFQYEYDDPIDDAESLAEKKKHPSSTDYIGRVEKIIPDLFSNKELEHLKSEHEKLSYAKILIERFPDYFKEIPEEKLTCVPYPDMSLQDEVMRLSEEYTNRLCNRPKPYNPFVIRFKFTEEEEEKLVYLLFFL